MFSHTQILFNTARWTSILSLYLFYSFTFWPSQRDSWPTAQLFIYFFLKRCSFWALIYSSETFSLACLTKVFSRVTACDARRPPLCICACNWRWAQRALPLPMSWPPFPVHLGGAPSLWDQSGEAQPLPGAAGALPPEAAARGSAGRPGAHPENPGEVQHARREDPRDRLQGEEAC